MIQPVPQSRQQIGRRLGTSVRGLGSNEFSPWVGTLAGKCLPPCLNVKIQALIWILKFEAGSKFSPEQRLTVNHATLHPKSIRGLNFYRSARLQLSHRHNAGAVCAYVFRESTLGQT